MASESCTKKQMQKGTPQMDYLKASSSTTLDVSLQQSHNALEHRTSSILKYAAYLKCVYKKRTVPLCPKWPPTPSKRYINLALIKRDNATLAEAYQLTTARLHGSIDQILKKKESIAMDQILVPGSDGEIKCILVEGIPGVGKSTFAWEFCRNWEILPILSTYSLVVLIQLREKKVQEAQCLSDLLFHRNTNLKQSVAADIEEEEGHGVLFVFDGFDELPTEQRALGSIFLDIINGFYLPKATVIITSRPSVTAGLLAKCKPQISKHIEILGFTDQNIKDYVCSVLKPEEVSGFMSYTSGNPLVYSMMYIPLNSAIVLEIYRQKTTERKPVPTTKTQLYDALTHTLIRRHLIDTGVVNNTYFMPSRFQDLPQAVFQQFRILSELAFKGISTQQLTWNDLPISLDHLGLMTKTSNLHVEQGPEISFHFFHLTVQEFLAAMHISMLSIADQKQIFKQHDGDAHFQVVWRFLAGLTRFEYLSWEVFKLSNREPPPRWLKADYSLKTQAIHCLYEAQNETACKEVCTTATTIAYLPDTASPFDCYALSYCIVNSLCTWVLDFINAGIDCDALDIFVRGLNSKSIEGRIKELRLGKNRMGRRGIECLARLPSNILQHMPMLKLYNCDLDSVACERLAEVLSSTVTLQELDIGVNPIGSGGAVKLITSLANLDSLTLLDIASSTLGCSDICALSRLIAPPCKLKVLKIGDSGMTIKCLFLMLRTLLAPSTLQHLDIRDCDLTTCANTMQELLARNDNLNTLELTWCKLGSVVANSIAQALENNNTLTVFRLKHPSLGLQPAGSASFAQMLKANCTLEELTITGDDSLGEGTIQLHKALKCNHTLKLCLE